MIGACKRAWRYYYVALALSWTVSYAYPSEVEQFRFRYLREFVPTQFKATQLVVALAVWAT